LKINFDFELKRKNPNSARQKWTLKIIFEPCLRTSSWCKFRKL